MRYRIRRVSPSSAIGVSVSIGWLIALCPSACIAGVLIRLLQGISAALLRLQSFSFPIDLGLTTVPSPPINLLQTMGLEEAARQMQALGDQGLIGFVLLTLALTLAATIVMIPIALLLSGGYNLVARISGGLEVELKGE